MRERDKSTKEIMRKATSEAADFRWPAALSTKHRRMAAGAR